MMFAFWRSLYGKQSASAPRRVRASTNKRTVFALESLESRDLLSGFTPLFTLEPHAGLASPYNTTAATGYSPGQISAAYGFNQVGFNGGAIAGNGSGQTIAIVDAYNDPNIASDLQHFDAAFGLPNPPIFRVVNQSGGGYLPAANTSWGVEESLDVEWAHAMAPGANIVLVEANSGNESDLFSAVQTAASLPGVSVVSMSWGGGEFWGETNYDGIFTTPPGHQPVAFIASSGDSGAPASYPAVAPNVLAVGGTSLHMNGSGYGSESGWSGSGGGVSIYEPQPSYQQGVVSQSSTQRASPDVAYNADPNTGMSVYDSFGSPAGAPWLQVGGTSAGAPQWAALVAIADQGRALKVLGTLSGSQLVSTLYQLPSSDFHEVTSGASMGFPSYSAGPGYDLVTGLGSPNAPEIVGALSQQAIIRSVIESTPSAPGAGAAASSTRSASPSTAIPYNQVAMDAFFIVEGWATGNMTQMLAGWQDFVSTLYSNPSAAGQLEGALISDAMADLVRV